MEQSRGEDKTGDTAQVLQWVMDQGHLDELRKKVLEQLKHNAELRGELDSMLQKSETLSKVQPSDLTGGNKRKVYDKLRKELDKKLVEKAAAIAWRLINDPQGDMYKLIETKAHEGLCAVYQQQHEEAEKGGLLVPMPRDERTTPQTIDTLTSPQMHIPPSSLRQRVGTSNPGSAMALLPSQPPAPPSSTATAIPQPQAPPPAPAPVRPPAPPPGAPPPPSGGPPLPAPPTGQPPAQLSTAVSTAMAATYGTTSQPYPPYGVPPYSAQAYPSAAGYAAAVPAGPIAAQYYGAAGAYAPAPALTAFPAVQPQQMLPGAYYQQYQGYQGYTPGYGAGYQQPHNQ